MAALAIARSIKELIERHVDARTNLLQDIRVGDGGIWVQRAIEYRAGETIVLKNNDKAEVHTIQCVDEVNGSPVLVLCEDATAPFAAVDSWVMKTYSGQTIRQVLIGNPDHIDNYPAITIEVSGMTREPFTLGSVSDTFNIEVGVWQDATSYHDAYETLLQITDKVENALFKQISPLVEPYFATILLEDVTTFDTFVRVVNGQLAAGSIIWLENSRGFKRHNRVIENHDAGVLELAYAVGYDFCTGDTLVHPLVHIYDARVESTSYDDAFDNDHLLKSSTIKFSAKLQKLRTF